MLLAPLLSAHAGFLKLIWRDCAGRAIRGGADCVRAELFPQSQHRRGAFPSLARQAMHTRSCPATSRTRHSSLPLDDWWCDRLMLVSGGWRHASCPASCSPQEGVRSHLRLSQLAQDDTRERGDVLLAQGGESLAAELRSAPVFGAYVGEFTCVYLLCKLPIAHLNVRRRLPRLHSTVGGARRFPCVTSTTDEGRGASRRRLVGKGVPPGGGRQRRRQANNKVTNSAPCQQQQFKLIYYALY